MLWNHFYYQELQEAGQLHITASVKCIIEGNNANFDQASHKPY